MSDSNSTWCGFCGYNGPELAADLRELRQNVLLGLGMTPAAVAAMDADMMEPAITYLLSGYNELAAEVARLEAELIQTRKDTLRVLDEMRAHHKAEISLAQGFAAHAEGLIMERDELSRARAELAEAEVARLRALINRKNQDYDEVLNDYEEMRAAWEAAQAENAALMDWRECALSVGEAIADTGPAGYYDMPPATWWEWALKRVAALRSRLDAAGGEWRPVSDAPDEIDIDYLVWHQGRVDIMAWSDDGWTVNFTYWSPSHWRPVPAPPQE